MPIRKRMKCFRMRGKIGAEHFDPTDPPRRRANKQRGHGTYENDRPPVVGTVGRETGQVRFRVVHQTTQATLEQHIHHFTATGATCYTDEWNGYQHLMRPHATVSHGQKEWARDDDGDGKREVHIQYHRRPVDRRTHFPATIQRRQQAFPQRLYCDG